MTEPNTQFDPSLFADQEDLQAAEALFNQGKEQAGRGNPEGTFQCIIREAKLGRSQSSNTLQISYNLEIAAGPLKGTKLFKYDGLKSEKQIAITLGQLGSLGVDVKTLTLSKVPAILLKLKDTPVQVKAKQNGEFYNIFFLKAIKKPVPGSTAPQKKF